MDVKIEKDELVIRIKMSEAKGSTSGKTMLVASETKRGAVDVKGKSLTVGVNAYYKV